MNHKEQLNKFGKKTIVMPFVLIFVQGILFFISSSQIRIPKAWLYFSIAIVITIINSIYMWKFIPHLANQRGTFKPDTKSWDRILLPLFILIPTFFSPIVTGLDVGRYKWSNMSNGILFIGVCSYLFADFINLWSMSINMHFEGTVRIQEERNHKVITSGPYRVIRHPGYLSMIIGIISAPMIIGSIYGLIPALLTVAVLIARTILEDRFLKKELSGYLEYSHKVKYKLFPGIW